MAAGLGWFPWRQLEIESPLTVGDAREALLSNVPSIFQGRVGLAGFELQRKSVLMVGAFEGAERTRVRVTLRLSWQAYGMLLFGVLGFPVLLGRGMLQEPSASWGFLLLAGIAFVLSGISPAWRFHRSARWSEHALRAILGAESVRA